MGGFALRRMLVSVGVLRRLGFPQQCRCLWNRPLKTMYGRLGKRRVCECEFCEQRATYENNGLEN